MITIVFGPQASGKTQNAEALRQTFEADRIVDDWPNCGGNRHLLPIQGNDLILTNLSVAGIWIELGDDRRPCQIIPINVALEMVEARNKEKSGG